MLPRLCCPPEWVFFAACPCPEPNNMDSATILAELLDIPIPVMPFAAEAPATAPGQRTQPAHCPATLSMPGSQHPPLGRFPCRGARMPAGCHVTSNQCSLQQGLSLPEHAVFPRCLKRLWTLLHAQPARRCQPTPAAPCWPRTHTAPARCRSRGRWPPLRRWPRLGRP